MVSEDETQSLRAHILIITSTSCRESSLMFRICKAKKEILVGIRYHIE